MSFVAVVGCVGHSGLGQRRGARAVARDNAASIIARRRCARQCGARSDSVGGRGLRAVRPDVSDQPFGPRPCSTWNTALPAQCRPAPRGACGAGQQDLRAGRQHRLQHLALVAAVELRGQVVQADQRPARPVGGERPRPGARMQASAVSFSWPRDRASPPGRPAKPSRQSARCGPTPVWPLAQVAVARCSSSASASGSSPRFQPAGTPALAAPSSGRKAAPPGRDERAPAGQVAPGACAVSTSPASASSRSQGASAAGAGPDLSSGVALLQRPVRSAATSGRNSGSTWNRPQSR